MSIEGKHKHHRSSLSPTLLGFQIVTDFGVTIAAPILLLTWIGKKLDLYYQTRPLFLIIGFVLAFLISAIAIYQKAVKYGKMFRKV